MTIDPDRKPTKQELRQGGMVAAAVLAIAARAGYLAGEALSEVWQLTDRRLIGPGGRSIPLGQIASVQGVLGAVQVITWLGDKHLIKYQAMADATRATIVAELAGRPQGS